MRNTSLLSLLFMIQLYGQSPQTISMSAPPPPSATNISTQVINGGNSTYYYWIVANYPIGKVISNSSVVFRAPDIYSSSSHVNVGWSVATGATSYDVLRTTTATAPTGTTNSRVSLAQTTTSFNDTIVTPSSYALTPLASAFNGAISIDNTNNATAMLGWTLPAVTLFPVTTLLFGDGSTQTTAGAGSCATCVTTSVTLTTGLPLIGNGLKDSAIGTRQGTTSKYVAYAGSAPATNDCAKFDASGNLTTAGTACGSGGGGSNSTYVTTTFSATPTFTANAGTETTFLLTLTGNVSSSTFAALSTGQRVTTIICQDGTGSRSFVGPTNLQNFPGISPTAHYCTEASGIYDGTNVVDGVATVFKDDYTNIGNVLSLNGSTSGTTTITPAAVASGALTLPARTATIATTTGATTTNHCAKFDSSGNVVDNGSACAAGGGSTIVPLIATQVGNGSGVQVPGGTTRFIPVSATLGQLATESDIAIQLNRTGTLQNYCVTPYRTGSQPGDGTLVLTLRLNGVNTALVITIPASTSGITRFCDSTHTVALAANDIITASAANSASTGSILLNSTTLELAP